MPAHSTAGQASQAEVQLRPVRSIGGRSGRQDHRRYAVIPADLSLLQERPVAREINMDALITTYPSGSTVAVRAVLIDRLELEHRVAVGLGHEILDRSVLVGTKVWPGSRGHGDVALEYRSGLRCRDLADGIVTAVPASGQAHSSGSGMNF